LAIARLEPHVTVEASVSIGNIYNYYKGKEEIYLSVVQRYELHMEKLRKKSLVSMKDFFDPARIAEYGTRDPRNRLRKPKRRIHGPDV
jgi:AcrR family transcriptional regulator